MADYIVHKAVELSAVSTKTLAALEREHDWLISPKYDGCHVVFCFANGQHLATYSRTGELVQSMPHIAQDLMRVYPSIKTMERIAICGEAWIVGKEFNEISGMFRRQSPQHELQFMPFDCVPFDFNDETTSGPPVLLGYYEGAPCLAPYRLRLRELMKRRAYVISNVLTPRAYMFRGTLQDAKADADAEARRNKASTTAAYDGAILAQANGLYSVGSGKGGEFIKCKPLLSYSVKVTATVSDIGGKTGKNTCVLMFNLDGKDQKVSTGLTQAQADEYTAYPERIIDKTIEVEAMGITVNGFLREPRFKGIRTDA